MPQRNLKGQLIDGGYRVLFEKGFHAVGGDLEAVVLEGRAQQLGEFEPRSGRDDDVP